MRWAQLFVALVSVVLFLVALWMNRESEDDDRHGPAGA